MCSHGEAEESSLAISFVLFFCENEQMLPGVSFSFLIINVVFFFLDLLRWRATIHHVKQYKQLSDSCGGLGANLECEDSKTSTTSPDELSIIMNVYADCLTRMKKGI